MKAALLGLAILAIGIVSAPAEIVISGFGTAGVNPVNLADDLRGSWNGEGTLTTDALDLANVSNVANAANGIYSDLTADGRSPVLIDVNTAQVTLTGTLASLPPGIDKFSISLYDTSGSFNELDYTFQWSSFAAGGANSTIVVGTLSGSSGVFNGTVGSWSLNLFDATGVAPTTLSVQFSDLGIVTASPQITSVRTAQATVGQSFGYQITATNSPVSYAATGLPNGLGINPVSGTITGIPTVAGEFSVSLSASNAYGTSMNTLTLTVNPLTASFYPSITSAATAAALAGQPFSYQVTATNNPVVYGASGLPSGLEIDAASGLIFGTATETGIFNVSLSASNASGTGTATLTLTVGGVVSAAAPVITSATNVAAQVGTSFSYQITATNAPASFAASGLPGGLTTDAATGIISGVPTTAGTFVATLSASNASGAGTATLTLTVAPLPVVTVATAGDNKVTEGGSKGKVVFRRTGDTSTALLVRYKTAGTAKKGVDYKSLAGTVTIPANAEMAKIKIKPIDNETVDGTRVIKVKLLPSLDGSYGLGAATVAKIKIIDNDLDSGEAP